MRLFKIFDNNVVFLLSCLKQSFFRDYYPMGNMDFYEDELRKEKYLIKLRGLFLLVEYVKLVARHNLNKPRGLRKIKKTKWSIPKQFLNFKKKRKVFMVILENFILMVQKILVKRSGSFLYNEKRKAQFDKLIIHKDLQYKNSVYLKWLQLFLKIF